MTNLSTSAPKLPIISSNPHSLTHKRVAIRFTIAPVGTLGGAWPILRRRAVAVSTDAMRRASERASSMLVHALASLWRIGSIELSCLYGCQHLKFTSTST